jgi:magnesium-transporting ATPase (P-type)
MFIGHYALGFAGKKIDKRPSLGTFFMAVQWLDLVWPVLVLTGVETMQVEPGNTVFTPLNFVSYPWSHSLLAAIGWGLLFGLFYFARSRNGRGSILLGALVLSHWVLDWITHRPDLQWSPFSDARTGLGLWNNFSATLVVEIGIFIAGVLLYVRATRARNKTGSWAFWGFVVFLLVFEVLNAFGPPPEKADMVAWMALSQWLLVAWGYWIDKNRE